MTARVTSASIPGQALAPQPPGSGGWLPAPRPIRSWAVQDSQFCAPVKLAAQILPTRQIGGSGALAPSFSVTFSDCRDDFHAACSWRLPWPRLSGCASVRRHVDGASSWAGPGSGR
jgi:hypothetical protein